MKTVHEAQEYMREILPAIDSENSSKRYQVPYAVHRITSSSRSSPSKSDAASETEVLGLAMLKASSSVPISDTLGVKTDIEHDILRLEIGYMFLPQAWGKGYASEACVAILDACRRCKPFFAPCTKLYVEGFVSNDNPASVRVLEKAGLKFVGVNEWEDEPVWLAGKWRGPSGLLYGNWIFE